MISKKMFGALNSQITKEFYSAYLYLSMASYFESETLPGFAHWMRIQAQEESSHGLILFNYVVDQDGRVVLGAVEAPPSDFTSPLDVFKKTLGHEREVTASIHRMVKLALEEGDFATHATLNWFVTEQVEEEANAKTLIGKLERCKSSSEGLAMLDTELAARVFTVPPPLVGKL
ncbi:MAG: ferritin [Candidatus Riflebacteria bacterium]|nr:ferritin [Candidatus Riflebacteria bacterium]